MKSKLYLFIFLQITTTVFSQTKVLFDASKAQMAGNADWIVDADIFNIRFTDGPASLGGFESNPQQIPTPAQSGITATTPEDYWTGGISAWAVDCAKLGYVIETLSYNKLITYGDATNPQDLSNYKVFITVEPNILYTTTQKTALINFVQNGGGLFLVGDHEGADRNNDGFDAPEILNDLMNNNSVATNLFGINFNINNTGNITSTNVANLPLNPLLNGTFGAVTQLKYSQGASMILDTTTNPNAKGLIFTTGSSNTGTSNVLFATSTYGSGKVAALGDSSPPDDGTGDSGDNLYFGYSDLNGNHKRLIMNATVWLATTNLASSKFDLNEFNFNIAPNPINNNELKLNYLSIENNNFSVEIFDLMGKKIQSNEFSNSENGFNTNTIQFQNLNSGIYLCKINNEFGSKTIRFIKE
jgi:Secretion system C-terminal sorting domain